MDPERQIEAYKEDICRVAVADITPFHPSFHFPFRSLSSPPSVLIYQHRVMVLCWQTSATCHLCRWPGSSQWWFTFATAIKVSHLHSGSYPQAQSTNTGQHGLLSATEFTQVCITHAGDYSEETPAYRTCAQHAVASIKEKCCLNNIVSSISGRHCSYNEQYCSSLLSINCFFISVLILSYYLFLTKQPPITFL